MIPRWIFGLHTLLVALLSRDTLPNTLPALRRSQRDGTAVLIQFLGALLSQKDPTLHFAVLREKALQCFTVVVYRER